MAAFVPGCSVTSVSLVTVPVGSADVEQLTWHRSGLTQSAHLSPEGKEELGELPFCWSWVGSRCPWEAVSHLAHASG